MSLNYLNSKLNSLPIVDLLSLNLNEYRVLVSHFENLFSHFNELEKDQITVVWLYMAFSHYLHNRARKEQFSFSSGKLALLKTLDLRAYPLIGQCIRNINDTHLENYRGFRRHYHQQVLMFTSNLFGYIQDLLKYPEINSSELLDKTIYSVSGKHLEISRKEARERELKPRGHREKQTAAVMYEQLGGVAFQPLKSRENPEMHYIDDESGLELDFPLQRKIAIETDGAKFHRVGAEPDANSPHHLVHNFQSFTSRELGWTRIGLDADDTIASKAEAIAKLLNIQEVAQFQEKYQELINILHDVRTRILRLSGPSQYVHLDTLIALELKLRNFVEQKYLKKFLKTDHSALVKTNKAREKIFSPMKKNNEDIKRIEEELNLMQVDVLAAKKEISKLSEEKAPFEKKLNGEVIPAIRKYQNYQAQYLRGEIFLTSEQDIDQKIYLQKRKEQQRAIEAEIAPFDDEIYANEKVIKSAKEKETRIKFLRGITKQYEDEISPFDQQIRAQVFSELHFAEMERLIEEVEGALNEMDAENQMDVDAPTAPAPQPAIVFSESLKRPSDGPHPKEPKAKRSRPNPVF